MMIYLAIIYLMMQAEPLETQMSWRPVGLSVCMLLLVSLIPDNLETWQDYTCRQEGQASFHAPLCRLA